jgi:hypothetical protein
MKETDSGKVCFQLYRKKLGDIELNKKLLLLLLQKEKTFSDILFR